MWVLVMNCWCYLLWIFLEVVFYDIGCWFVCCCCCIRIYKLMCTNVFIIVQEYERAQKQQQQTISRQNKEVKQIPTEDYISKRLFNVRYMQICLLCNAVTDITHLNFFWFLI